MLGSDIAVSVLFGLVLPDRQSICAQSLQSFELLCSYLAEWDAKPSIPVVHLGRHLLTLFVPRRSPLTCLFHLSIQRWMQQNISLDTSLKWMSHLSLQQLSCLLLPHQAKCSSPTNFIESHMSGIETAYYSDCMAIRALKLYHHPPDQTHLILDRLLVTIRFHQQFKSQ